MFFDIPAFATDFERIPRASVSESPVVSKTSSFASNSGIVGCAVVADSVEVIGDASNPGGSKRFDLRSNEVFDRFLLLDFASSSRF